jgi:eukaryotic-like serine/threonine-protein kinase
MDALNGDTTPLPTTSGSPPIAYRCVCGQVIAVDPGIGGSCQACGRRYHARVLRGTDTMSVSDSIAPLELDVAHGDRVGERFGHYQITHELGTGGMGQVFQALDESLQRYVALKVIRPHAVAVNDRTGTDRMLQEAVAQARLNHPHVVHIYFVGHQERSPFLAMELVSGPTLAQRLERGPLPFANVIEIALQVVSALQHAANFDIVHGDIKPSNLLMVDDQTVKLSDFGLARRMSESLVKHHSITGSPNYISPEGALGEPTDVRSDMYSLGVMLFEMTFGRLPFTFKGSGIMERLEAHQSAPPEFPEVWPNEIPSAWREVLSKLLAKSPANRYAIYGQLADDIGALRPVLLPAAGRLQRAVAWWTDLGLVFATQQFIAEAPPYLLGRNTNFTLPPFVLPALSLLPLVLFCYLQMWWRTSPGKYLFQIRIVDPNGLVPSRRTLLSRAVAQLWPTLLWTVPTFTLLFGLQADVLRVITFLLAVPLAADAACAFLHPRGLSLHDLFFRTQVMLDVRPFEQTERGKRKKKEEEEYWNRAYWSPLKREVRRLRRTSSEPKSPR